MPHYEYYDHTSLYNSGKDYDFLYGHIPPNPYTGIVEISGYHKPNSSSTRNQLEWVKMYHRASGTSGAWTETMMTYQGNLDIQ